MTAIEYLKSKIQNPEERETFVLSLIYDVLYCPCRAALKLVEGWREAASDSDYAL